MDKLNRIFVSGLTFSGYKDAILFVEINEAGKKVANLASALPKGSMAIAYDPGSDLIFTSGAMGVGATGQVGANIYGVPLATVAR